MSGEIVTGLFVLVGAVVSLIGTILINLFQLKRDSDTIKKIDGTVKKTGGNVSNISQRTTEIKTSSAATQKRVYDIDKRTEQHSAQLQALYDDMHERKGREQAYSECAGTKNSIQSNVEFLFDKIVALEEENRSLNDRILELNAQILQLQHQQQISKPQKQQQKSHDIEL